MSLGVLNNISAIYAQNSISSTQTSLQKTLQQLSSGSQINSGADNAAGLAVADGLAANSTALAQSAKNANDAIGLLQTADGALSQVTTLLNRAVTLATQASNSTLTSSQVSSANQEYQNILTQVNNIGGSTNFNGSAVFTNAAKSFFVSDGTSAGSINYNDIVGTLTSSSIGTTQGAAQVTSTVAPTAVAAPVTTASPSTSTLTLASTSNVVSGTLSLGLASGTQHTISVAANTTGTALAAQVNADATYQAAGISATYNSSTGVVSFSGKADATGGNIVTSGTSLTQGSASATTNVTQTATTAASVSAAQVTTLTLGASTNVLNATGFTINYDSGGAVAVTAPANATNQQLTDAINSTAGLSGKVSASLDGSGNVVLTGAAVNKTFVLSAASTLTQTTVPATTAAAPAAASVAAPVRGGSTTLTLGAINSTVAGTLSIAVAGGTAASLTVKAGTTLSQLSAAINSNADFKKAGLTASYDSTAGTLTVAAAAGSSNTIATTGTSLTQTTAATVGAGVDFTQSALSSLSSDSGANANILNSLTAAIGDIAYQRGTIGANINQLSSAQSVASNEQTNLTAAENNIRATDYGAAASNLSKYQVLSQTGISALAQANSVQQEVLKLLQ